MPDLHHEVLALIEAGPQLVPRSKAMATKLFTHTQESPQAFASRIALRAVELEREAEQKSILNVLRGLDGRVPTASEWKMICGVARELEKTIRRRGKP